MTHHKFDGNPIPINAILAVAGFVVGTALVIFVFVSVRQMGGQDRVDEEERESLLLEEDEEEEGYEDNGSYR